jgi:ribosome-associated heat shock protein Hsp15
MSEGPEPVRIDKWLWAARLFKTRSLAADAVKAGRVAIDGQRVKPSRDVRIGDEIEVRVGQVRTVVVVKALSPRRGPASEAALLYDETAESRAGRERFAAERRAAAQLDNGGGRPTKRDRRRFDAGRGR